MTRPTPSVPRKTSGNAFLLIEALAFPWVAGARGGIEIWTATNAAASRAFWKKDKGWLVEWTDPDKPARLMALNAELGKGDVALKRPVTATTTLADILEGYAPFW